MILLDLKKLVNSLSEEDLKKPFYVLNRDEGIGCRVESVEKSRVDLYGTAWRDDEIPLRTKTECIKEGIKGEEFEELELLIERGDLVFKF